MKVKTFILTFLMMMSSPFLFGQHWEDPGDTGYNQSMSLLAQIFLDDDVQEGNYEVAAFYNDELLGVGQIVPLTGTTSNYHVHLNIQGNTTLDGIYFKFFNDTNENEYVSSTEMSFTEGLKGSHSSYEPINFYSVAQIGDVVYPSLQKAINACKEGDNTIELLADNAEDVTIKQVEGVNVTIDGGTSRYDYSGTITIHGNARYQGEETLTFKNIDFTTNEANHYFIDSNSTASAERYAHNVTVKDCNFTATDAGVNSAVAMRIRQGFDIAINGGTFTNLHSALQAYGNAGITVSGITLTGKNGISAGTSTGVVIEDSDITATGYGVRADGTGAYEMTLTNNTISAELPVVVRKATGDYKLEVNGGSYTASNTEGYDVVFTNGDDGTYEAPTGVFQLTIDEGTDLNVFPVYVAKIGTKGYQSLAEAYTAATDGQIITLLDNITLSEKFVIAKSITLDGNGKTLTYTGIDRAIDIYDENIKVEDVTIKNLTLDFISGYSQRGINYNEDGKLTLEKVTVNGSSVVTYAVNLPSKSTGANVTITDSNITGKIALNVWGANAIINATDSHFTSVDNATHENYAAVKLNNNGTDSAEGAVITITRGSITAKDENEQPSSATTNATATGVINISETTEVIGNIETIVAIVTYEGASEFYGCFTLQEAIDKAGDDSKATVKLLSNIETSELIKVEKSVVIDLNGKTVTANCKKAFEVYANATIKNGKIWSQQRCVDTRKNVELTLADVTLEAPTYYNTHQNQQPLTIGGSDNGTKVTMTNVNINAGTQGYAIISFVKTDLTATNSNMSGYSALYVKEGSVESEFKFEGSTLKGDIGSNDVEGNSFATIATEANNVTVTLDANSILESVGQNHLAISVESEGNVITVAGGIAATNFLDGSTNVNANNIKVKAEYADELLAEGYVTSEADANGLVQVSGLAVAKIGETYYKTLAEAFAAAQNDDEVKILAAGTYALSTSGKNITITGAVDGVVFDNIGAKNMGGANVTFNSVTFNYATNSTYKGLQHSGNLTYNNCTINGQVFLYGESETFNNCIFSTTDSNNYNVWTYGAKEVAFNKCTFNSAGKSVLIYSEDKNLFNNVAVTECEFIASSPVEGKAAIEMDSSLTAGISLTIDGATATGFGSGNVSGNSLWNNKKGNNDMANNDITVVVNGVTVLKPWAPVAKIGETPYETLAKAISAATAGQTITICSDVNENVTINKNLTIDGGYKNYTGTMTVNTSLIVTVQNVNFVKGCIDETKGTSGTLTVKNCDFDGVDNSIAYAVTMRGGSSLTVDGCTGKNYDYGMVYVPSAVSNVSVIGTTVEGVGYGVHVAYGTIVNIENVTMTGVAYGIMTQNYGAKTITIKNSSISATNPIYVWERNTTVVDTFKFEGDNTFSGLTLSAQAKLVLAEANAKLTAPEGYNVTTSVVNFLVKHENGIYVVKPAVAKIGDIYYETLTEAINAADNGATIDVLPVTINEYVAPWAGVPNHSTEKSITIVGSKDAEGNLTTTMTAGMYLGYDDSQCREHTIVVKDINFTGKGLKVACQQNVTIEGNTFSNITEGQAIAVVGKNINSIVKNNVINGVTTSNQGIELRNTLTATVEGNTISNTGHNALQITSQVGATESKITVTNNTMSNWGTAQNAQGELEGRAMRISNIITANINGNVMSHTAAPEEFVKVTGSTTLDASANYWNGVSPLATGMFTGVEGDLVPVLKSYYTDPVMTEEYLVILQASVAKIGETYYSSLASAIAAAEAGSTIELIKDIEENVTISKRLTIDGGGHNSKGLISTDKNVTYTFKNFNIDGTSSYFVKVTGGGGNYVFDNCNIKNSWGLIHTNKSTNTVTIKNSQVDNCEYGVGHFVSLNSATLENVTVINSAKGLMVQNQAAKTINFVKCAINATDPVYIWTKGTSVITFKFEGENELVGTIGEATTTYAKFVLAESGATLAAQEGMNVTTTVDGCVVEYEDGVYSVVPANVLNSTTGKKYATIQDAINAAENGDKIVVLEDLILGYEDAEQMCDNAYRSFINVDGKTVTIDLNGCMVKAELGEELKVDYVYGMVTTENEANLTIEDNSEEKTGTMWIDNAVEVYSLVFQYDGSVITINSGNYKLNVGGNGRGMIYSNDDEKVTVNGGTFILGNVGKLSNGSPWIFNVSGQNTKNIIVNGGTFNDDILHQYYPFEVMAQKEKALKYDAVEELWTMVDAVAYVDEQHKSGNWYTNEVGFVTLEEAFAAAAKYNHDDTYVTTVTLLANVELENTITVNAGKDVILDLNGKTITGKDNNTSGSFNLFVNKGTFEIKDDLAEGTGKITLEATTNRYWNASSSIVSNSAGTLTITSGTLEHLGGTDMAYGIDNNSTSGLTTLNVNGGKIASPYRAIRQFQNSLQDNVVVVNGGTISARAGIWMQQPSTNDKAQLGTLTINDGSIFECVSNAVVIDICGGAQSNVTINGGTFSNTNENANLLLIWPLTDMNSVHENCSAVMNITGGNFTCAGEGNLIGILEGADTNGDVVLTGGIYSEDVNAYCAKGFAAVDNGDGTWTVMPVQKQSLVAGWNWYSSYLKIKSEDLLLALGTNGSAVVSDNGGGDAYYDESYGWDNSLTENLDLSKMYMIETSIACDLNLAGELADASTITITLNPGWNWIGYPSNVETRISDAFSETPENGDVIKTKANSFAEYYAGQWYDGGVDMTMEPTKGYMYYNASNVTKTFTYNIVPVRGTNETIAETHYSVDYTKYPFNMTMVAVVDGAMNDNYEVAALVNGEVRGSTRPVYIESMDAYMLFLSINGDTVEEMTFKYYDLTTGEEYDLVNRIDYSNNAMIGSVNEPYVLSRGTTGIGDAAMSQVNIYPNPTTTGTEINLQTVCDTVEVFNALGVKVAEYQNVDSIDALETAGIYVIRITNDGNVQNCRLVVK